MTRKTKQRKKVVGLGLVSALQVNTSANTTLINQHLPYVLFSKKYFDYYTYGYYIYSPTTKLQTVEGTPSFSMPLDILH